MKLKNLLYVTILVFCAINIKIEGSKVCPGNAEMNSDGTCKPIYTGLIDTTRPGSGYCKPGWVFQKWASSCAPCPAGSTNTSYVNNGDAIPTVAVNCTRCAPGTFAAQAGSASCIPCPVGQMSTEDATKCVMNPNACPAGSQFLNNQCSICPIGYFSTKAGSPACTKCPTGYTTIKAGATSCMTNAAVKNFNDNAG